MTIPADLEANAQGNAGTFENLDLAQESPENQNTAPEDDAPPEIMHPEDETPMDNMDEDEDEDEDEDDITVIILDEAAVSNTNNNTIASHRTREQALAWIDASQDPAMEERRRGVLMRELKRVQRASFWQFLMLCTIPTILLIVVIGTVVGDEQDCASDTTHCALEPRTFINAFTTRCICDALQVETDLAGLVDAQEGSSSP